jgi:hypothetical protein
MHCLQQQSQPADRHQLRIQRQNDRLMDVDHWVNRDAAATIVTDPNQIAESASTMMIDKA